MARGVVAGGLAIGLVGWGAVHAGGGAAPRLLTVGAAATVLVVAGVIVGLPEVVAGGVAGIVGIDAIAVVVEPTAMALPVGLCAFVFAETAFAAVDLGPAGATSAAKAQRLRFLVTVVVLAALAGGLALAVASDVSTPQSLAVEALGGLAIAGVVYLVMTLSRRAQPQSSRLNRR